MVEKTKLAASPRERVRAARKAKGLSQEDLALESNTAPRNIGGVERGQRNPSFKKLCAIAKTVGVDVGALCRDLPYSHEMNRFDAGSRSWLWWGSLIRCA